jgi:hypothetical protein
MSTPIHAVGEILERMNLDDVERQADTLSLINIELTSCLDRQRDAITRIDNKAVLVIGYVLAVASFLATKKAEPILTGLAYGAFAAAAGFGISAVAVRNYQDIEPRPLFNDYAGKSHAETLAVMAAIRVKHFEFNRDRLKSKVRQWWISLIALLGGTLLMIVGILVHTY